MLARTQATIIMITWGVLLTLYVLNKVAIRSRFLKAPILVDLGTATVPKPGSFLSGAGVLFVFVINITAIGLVLWTAFSSTSSKFLSFLRLELPLWVHGAGSVLFVLYSLWGLLVSYFNPNYTPLYSLMCGQYIIATEGPYRLVRHPRYTAEAVANLILFLFTGFWFSLFGILGWAAIYAQARAEEQALLTLAPGAYGAYHRRTGMFFPRIHLPTRLK